MIALNSYVVKRIFIGMILILIGTLFLGSQLGVITVNPGEIASNYWPVIMILFGISGLLGQVKHRKETGSSYIWNLFVIALGVGFLARNLNYLNMSTGEYIKLLIPVFIILFGIRMMFRKERPSKIKQDYSNKYEYNYDYSSPSIPNPIPNFQHSHSTDHTYNPSAENRSGFFGDLYLGHDYWELKPMNISHFIGDTIIDLTKAQIPVGDTKLNISAFIGDVKVFVPNDMEVEVSVTSSSFLGDSTVFNKRESGFMRSVREESQDFTMSDKKIRLQVNLFIGDITIQRVG
ncbi:MAG: cell wall-active antibiotics response protein LiaF [Paenibacillaceae bacterium]